MVYKTQALGMTRTLFCRSSSFIQILYSIFQINLASYIVLSWHLYWNSAFASCAGFMFQTQHKSFWPEYLHSLQTKENRTEWICLSSLLLCWQLRSNDKTVGVWSIWLRKHIIGYFFVLTRCRTISSCSFFCFSYVCHIYHTNYILPLFSKSSTCFLLL